MKKGPSSATQRKNKPLGGGGGISSSGGTNVTTTTIETPLVASSSGTTTSIDHDGTGGGMSSTQASSLLLPLNSEPSSDNNSINRQGNGNHSNNAATETVSTTRRNNTLLSSTDQPPPNVIVAEVHRNFCGTGPFDKHWLNLDCCGLVCAFFTYVLHMYGCWAVCYKLLPSWMSIKATNGIREITIWGKFHAVIFCGIAIMAIMSHFYAMTTDPGAVPPDAQPLQPPQVSNDEDPEKGDSTNDETNNNNSSITSPRQQQENKKQPPIQQRGKRLCRRCNSYKPQRAHHCSICKRCIIKMDHHCPWVNNCVGIGNHKFFLLFLLYTFLSCMYSMTLLLVRFWTCLGKRRCLDTPTDLIPLIGLFVEAMLFGLFTCCMMTDQWDVVTTNVTQIDKLKGDYYSSNSAYHRHHHHHHPHPHSSSIPMGGINMSSIHDTTTNTNKPSGVLEVFGLQRPNNRKGSASSNNSNNTSTGFRIDWLIPFIQAHIPQGMKDEIMGFCVHTSNLCGSKDNKNNKKQDDSSPDTNEDMMELLPNKNNNGSSISRSRHTTQQGEHSTSIRVL